MRQALGRGATAEWGTRRKAITEVTRRILKPGIDACLGYLSNYAHGFDPLARVTLNAYVICLQWDIDENQGLFGCFAVLLLLPGFGRGLDFFSGFQIFHSCRIVRGESL